MTASVISYHRPRRKRGGAWGYALRRLGALAATIAALGAVALLTPRIPPPRPAGPPPSASASIEAAVEPALAEGDVALDLAVPAPPATRHSRQARNGVPLDGAGGGVPDGYEILSAAELDAISQARD